MRDDNTPFAQRLNSVANIISRSALRIYPSTTGLKTVEARALHGVGLYGANSVRDVARLIHINEAQVSVAVKTLTARGFVKSVSDPADKRRKLLKLTTSGKKVFKSVDKILHTRHDQILKGLSSSEQKRFFELLERVGENAEAMLERERKRETTRRR